MLLRQFCYYGGLKGNSAAAVPRREISHWGGANLFTYSRNAIYNYSLSSIEVIRSASEPKFLFQAPKLSANL